MPDAGKILQDMRNETDYLRLIKIGEYIDRHSGEFPDDEAAQLKDVYDDFMEKKFFHPQCSQIENIELRMRSGILSEEWRPVGMSRAQSMCSTAHNFDVPLSDWIYELYPDLLSFRVKIHVVSDYERQLAREIFPSPEARMERRAGARRQVPEEGEVNVGINMADLMNRYRDDIRELIDATNRNSVTEIEKLRKEVNSLQSRIESLRTGEEMPNAPKQISRVLDSAQYQYFLRNAYKMGLPVTYSQIARGEYQVSITVTGDEEKKALSFIEQAEAHERELSKTAKTHREGFEHVLDILCRVYAKEAHAPCGLSRTGALSTLADRFLEYASAKGMDWQEYDIGSIDLFARPGQIYTREQAQEAFNSFISRIEGRRVRESELESQEENECDVDTITTYIIDYDAIATIISQNLLPMNTSLQNIQRDAIQSLTSCGYYPLRLEEAREIASTTTEHYGVPYLEQVKIEVDRLFKRYGGVS
jgi:hypothetical protein